MKIRNWAAVCLVATALPSAAANKEEDDALKACAKAVFDGFRKVAGTRDERFNGKVSEANALCRGGFKALQFRATPWVDWANYWGAGDATTKP